MNIQCRVTRKGETSAIQYSCPVMITTYIKNTISNCLQCFRLTKTQRQTREFPLCGFYQHWALQSVCPPLQASSCIFFPSCNLPILPPKSSGEEGETAGVAASLASFSPSCSGLASAGLASPSSFLRRRL